MPSLKANSLESYIKIVMATDKPESTLFRGQPKDWDLVPKLARDEFRFGDILRKEREVFSEFKRSAPLLLGQMQVQDSQNWEWLALAQHHGMATRLLDWSKNPLIALYFAVENPYQGDKYEPLPKQHGVVWVLEYTDDQLIDSESEQDPFCVSSTRVFFPRCVTSRIINQSGCFTVHHFVDDLEEFIPLPRETLFKGRLKKIVIPAANFSSIREDLMFVGIHSASVYPDIDGLTKYLTRRISLSSDSKGAFVKSIKETIKARSPQVYLIR